MPQLQSYHWVYDLVICFADCLENGIRSGPVSLSYLTFTYLDLGRPVPAGTLGNELSPSGTVTGNTSDFIMSATATDTHCSHVFHERVLPRSLWPAPSSASFPWSPV